MMLSRRWLAVSIAGEQVRPVASTSKREGLGVDVSARAAGEPARSHSMSPARPSAGRRSDLRCSGSSCEQVVEDCLAWLREVLPEPRGRLKAS
jgi:hypothetical protein